jgi:hypothetical protein
MVDLHNLAQEFSEKHNDMLTEAVGLQLTKLMTSSIGHSHADRLLNQRFSNERDEGRGR